MMRRNRFRPHFERIRLMVLPAIIAALIGFLLSHDTAAPPVHAFSSGPPAGFTNAPGEFTCDECHVPENAGTGQISITAPQTYVPGQIYPITVTNTNADPTRLRWGYQLTVLDGGDERAGTLQNTDSFTQILTNQGPGGARQYAEHSALGTFIGQQGGSSWTFNWTAPATDIGPVTFYAAGNHANNDGNTSGDNVYFTFVASAPAATTPDFAVNATPLSRSVVPGGSAEYLITVTPLAGFTGMVSLSASGLPSGAAANFNPTPVNITDATSHNSTLTITTNATTPVANNTITVTGMSGMISRTVQINLNVISATSADLSLLKTASPNPGQVGANLSYRLLVTNSGPAPATNVTVMDTLPASGITFVSATVTQGACAGTGPVNCGLGTLASGASATITIVVTPTASGTIANSATVNATETDPNTANNSATLNTLIQPGSAAPEMIDPNLMVSTVVTGLNQPTSIAFLADNDFFVLEKASGRVVRITNGTNQGSVLDLAVNSASERGLLGIALHPQFKLNGYVYLFWTESSTTADTTNTDDITLMANRVDRFIWNGSTLTLDRNIIRLRALQQDAGQPTRANHNGGVLRFGLDGKLYILFGDNGRRGFMQNLPTGGPVPDDQFGGPQPDNAHLTGVILRLNDDGSTPTDNPFFSANTGLTGEAATNVRKVFAYGVRNGFGMGFDPLSGNLWTQENGDDSFDEMNRVTAGFNGGWIQVMGPIGRVDQFKSIEVSYGNGTLQQLRWSPTNIADTPQLALSRMYMLPGASYRDPEFSWKYAVAPSPLGFVKGRGLGPQFEGDMFVGGSRTTLENGYLFRFKLTPDRQHFEFTDPLLADLVADNTDKFDITESESLLIGRNFGITTDIQTAPNGNVFVVSLLNGAIYEIKPKPGQLFVATLTGAQEVPPNSSTATGTATVLLSPDEKTARVAVRFSGLSSAQTDAHIHGPAPAGVSGAVVFPLPLGQINDFEIELTSTQAQQLKDGLLYVNIHSSNFTAGEIRGQFLTQASASSLQFGAATYSVGEGDGSATIAVRRIGNTSAPITVNYLSTDGSANSRTDYTTSSGTIQFATGETLKTFSVPVIDDIYVEGNEVLTVSLSSPGAGSFLGSPASVPITIFDNDTITATTNPLDDPRFFVNQHYLDFLHREPDSGGLAYWTNEIAACGNDLTCIVNRRAGVSAAFFVESEFQEGGNFVYRLYKGALSRQPNYPEFNSDRGKVVVGAGLEASKVALVNEFVGRTEFMTTYPTSLSNAQFVNRLFDNAGLIGFPTERQQQIDSMNAGKTRAQVLRDVIDLQAFRDREFNPAFVLMQYFGYLRRDADAGGYAFWLDVINNRDPNNYRSMVCAFISSEEYQLRFSPVRTRTDQQCALLP